MKKKLIVFLSLLLLPTLVMAAQTTSPYGFNLLPQPTFNNNTAFVNLSGDSILWAGNAWDLNRWLLTNGGNSPTADISWGGFGIFDINNITFSNGVIEEVNYIQFNTSFNDGNNEGRLQWNIEDGTPEIGLPGGNVNLQIGQEQLVRAKNVEGSQINNGQVVRISGASGQKPEIVLASGTSELSSHDTIGLATEDIADGQKGYVTTFGLVRDINTSAFSDGDALFLSDFVPGALTNITPMAPNHSVRMGFVISSHATEGIVFVNVDNGFELFELHDVWYNFSESRTYEILQWNQTNGRFDVTTNPTFDNVTVNTIIGLDSLILDLGYNHTEDLTTFYDERYLTSQLHLYFYNNSDTFNSSYTVMNTSVPSGEAQVNRFTSLSDGNNLLTKRILSSINLTSLEGGAYDQHTTIDFISGTKDVQLISELYILYSNGTEVLIGLSPVSQVLTNGIYQQVQWTGAITNDIPFPEGSYLTMYLYAFVSGSGSAPTIDLVVADDTASRLDIGVNPADIKVTEEDPKAYNGSLRSFNPNQGFGRILFEGLGILGPKESSHESFTIDAFTNNINVASLKSAGDVQVEGLLGARIPNPQASFEVRDSMIIHTLNDGAGSTALLSFGITSGTGATAKGDRSADIEATRQSGNSFDLDFYSMDGSSNTHKMKIKGTGNIEFPSDNQKLLLGAGQDASIYYDGTNMVINPQEIGSGAVSISGALGIGTTSPSTALQISNTTGGIGDYISLKRGTTDWRVWTSDSESGSLTMDIGGNIANSFAWRFDWAGNSSNIFKSASNSPTPIVMEILGTSNQVGDYLAVSKTGQTRGGIMNLNNLGHLGLGGNATAGFSILDNSGGIDDFISLKRGTTDWRIWASDGTTGTPSMRIGGNSLGAYAWMFDWFGTNANEFKSASNTSTHNVINILGASGQSGDYLDLTSYGGSIGDVMKVDSAGDLTLNSLSGSYSNGEAYLCVFDNGTVFSKDSACL